MAPSEAAESEASTDTVSPAASCVNDAVGFACVTVTSAVAAELAAPSESVTVSVTV